MRPCHVYLLAAVLSGSAHADPPKDASPASAKAEAKAHAATGTQLFNVQAYDKAAEEYQQAYMLDADPNYLYAAAQAQRLGGDCDKALLSYKAYLRTKPNDEKALKNIERCEQDLKDHPRPAPAEPAPNVQLAPQAVVVAPTTIPQAAPAIHETITRPWSGDWIGHALVGGGVAVAATGVVLYLQGRSTISQNNSAVTYDQFAAGHGGVDSARTKETIGVSAMAIGGSLVLGGVLHYIVHGRPIDRTVSATLQPGGAAIALTGAF